MAKLLKSFHLTNQGIYVAVKIFIPKTYCNIYRSYDMGLKNPSIFYFKLMKEITYRFTLKKKTRWGLLKNGVEKGDACLIL
jgi:hypothetical protein